MSTDGASAAVGKELASFFKTLGATPNAQVDTKRLEQDFGLSSQAAKLLRADDTTAIEKHMKAAGLEQPQIFWPPGGQ